MKAKERIAIALERSGKSQRDLAKYMGLSSPTVSSMLAKDDIDSMKYLKAVQDITGYRFEWLRTGQGPETIGESEDSGANETFWQDKLRSKEELIDELRARITEMKKYQDLLEKQFKKK